MDNANSPISPETGEPIRVLLTDDHPALRVGLRVLLQQAPGIEVIGEVGTGREALELIAALQPDVVVLDCHLPEIEGVEVAAELRRRGMATRVLALSAHKDERYVRGMMEAGAIGYLLKEEAPRGIVAAVQAAAKGDSLWTAEQIARARHWDEVQTKWERLSERERAVLVLVAKGRSNKDIAKDLRVQIRTVEAHLTNLLKKLGLSSRHEAAAFVWQNKLVD